MKIANWKLISTKTKFASRWLNVVEKNYELADGRKAKWLVVEKANAVCIFCLTKEGKVVAIRHYRPGVDKIALDLPTGNIGEGETPLQAAKRELKEETGFQAEKFVSLGAYAGNASVNARVFHSFLALEGKRVHRQDLDETEEIQVKELTIGELMRKIESQEFLDSTRIATVFLALQKLGKLEIRL